MILTAPDRVKIILDTLDDRYGTDISCYLHYDTPWQLLISTILSAQCTDARVNEVTRDLYKKYPDIQAFADADLKELEQDIRSTGFYHNKARNIIECAKKLVNEYGGEVPSGLDELTSLPGVGRKTANVIRGNVYHEPSIVVDTHVGRISRRLSLTENRDPKAVEFDLMDVIPKDHWILINIQFIALGREICQSRKPKCSQCPLSDICVSSDKNID